MATKLSFRVRLAFGIGQLAYGAMNVGLSYFLLFYYNQVLGLSASLAGTAIGLSVVIDAFSDPVMGSLSDHWRSRFGRRHPFMYASIVPAAISFYFLFDPWVTSQTGLFVWLLVFTNLSRTAMSLYNIPHMALGAEMTEDYDERSSLVSHRVFCQFAGYMLSLLVGFGIFFTSTPDQPNGQLNAAAYPPYAMAISVLMVAVLLWTAWGTRSVIPNLPKTPDEPAIGVRKTIVRVFTDLFSSLANRSFRWLFGGMLAVFAVLGTNTVLDLYMYGYFWELDSDETMLVIVALPVASMLGAFVAPSLTSRWGKRTLLIWGVLGWAFFQTLPVALRLIGWFPENGHAWLVPTLVIMKAIQGATVVQADVAYGSMVADIVDEHELQTERRQEGIFFAASYFAAKATAGIGSVIAGFALDIIEWPSGAEVQTAADVPVQTILALGIFYGPLLASFGFLSAWCFTRYRLTRDRHAEILGELALRRG